MSLTAQDSKHMADALRLAEKGLYTTSPNPRVGAVIVAPDGEVVGRGWHQFAGEEHAEVAAIREAGTRTQGATCYVTLEPCSHQGRTGPCNEALIDAGISRVVFGHEDPNPKVAGLGKERLQKAGIQVDGPLMEREARSLNSGFIKRMSTGLPFVRIKLAMSMDARTAMADGDSFWITGPKARADVQRIRGRSCAVITGRETITQDQASLTVRPEEFGIEEDGFGARQPLRVVLDSGGKVDSSLPFFSRKSPVLLVSATDHPVEIDDVESISLSGDDGRVDLIALMHELAKRECNEVLVEAGAKLASAFVRQGLVDELIVYVAPKFMGDLARPLLHLPYDRMDESLPLRFHECCSIGRDLRITMIPEME